MSAHEGHVVLLRIKEDAKLTGYGHRRQRLCRHARTGVGILLPLVVGDDQIGVRSYARDPHPG